MNVKKYFVEFSLLILIKLLLEYLYINVIALNYSYSGLTYVFSYNNYVIGWAIYLFGYLILLRKKKLYIYEIFYLLYFIYVLPTIVFFELSNKSFSDFLILIIPYFVILLFVFERPEKQIKSFPNGKIIVLVLSFLAVVSVIIHYLFSTGGNFVLSFDEVYDFREKFGESNLSGIFGYLNSWTMKIFLVVLYSWALNQKNIKALILFIFFILIVFMLSGHKEALSGVFLIFFFKFLFKQKAKRRRIFILLSLFLLLFLIAINSFINGLSILDSLITRRLFFVPIHLNFTYIEFFSNHEYVYWSNSIFKYFLNYPYNLPPAFLIGDYLGVSGMSANTGFIATGYMHFGYFGLLIYVFLAIIILRVINRLGKKIKKYTVLSIVFLPINTLFMASDLFSTLLTHGLLIAVLVLWLYEDKVYIVQFFNKKFKV